MTPFIGQIQIFPYGHMHMRLKGWLPCDGSLLPISRFTPLYLLLENRFGGDGVMTFALPNYTKLAPKGCQYYIAIEGIMPFFG